MKIPNDLFGIKVVVGGVVELAKDYLHPIALAKGEARAELIRVRGAFEARRLENQLRVIEMAESRLKERGVEANPVNEDILYSVLEESGRTSNAQLHELWSDLLASAATDNADTNRLLTAISILQQLTPHDAMKIRYLLRLLPETGKETSVTSFWLNTGWKGHGVENESEFGCVSCTCTLYGEGESSESYDKVSSFGSWDEYAEFLVALRNLERIGLIVRLKSQKYPMSAVLEEFNFTLIGQLFLNAVGCFPNKDVTFTDIEFLDTLSK